MVFLRPVGLPTTLEETKSGTSPAVSLRLLLLTFMTIHLIQFRFADVVDTKTSGGNCPVHDSLRNRCWRSLIYWSELGRRIRFHVVRTGTCLTLLCLVHRYLLNTPFIVCLMGHTAVQTSVAQGFLAAQATLFHVLIPTETSRNVNLYNASPMRSQSLSRRPCTVVPMHVGSRWQPLRPSSPRPTSSDNFNIITLDHLLKNNAFIENIAYFQLQPLPLRQFLVSHLHPR